MALICAFTAIFSACSKDDQSFVATVNSQKITTQDLLDEIALSSQKYDKQILADENALTNLKKIALEKLIEENILLQEAKRLGIKPDEKKLKATILAGMADKKQLKEGLAERGIPEKIWKDAQRKRLTIDMLIDKEVFAKIPVSEDAIKKYYEKNTANYIRPSQYRAKQILVDNREKAEEILALIKKGESFDELAKQFSQSPDSKRGGDLGYFDAKSFPEVFSRVCGELNIGEMSGVVETDYGFQIFLLVDKRPARKLSLTDAAPEIRKTLTEQKAEESFTKWFSELKKNSTVQIDETAISKVALR